MTISYRDLIWRDIPQVAELHLQSLQEGLLYDMGKDYVEILYKVGLKSNNCFGSVAVNENDEIIGMACATRNIDHLFFRLIINPKFGLGVLRRIFRLKKLYPAAGTKIQIKSEFILFFVKPEYRNLYIALELMNRIEKEYAQIGIRTYSLEVKENNIAANKLYQYFGFTKIYDVGKGENKRIFYKKEIPNE